MTRRRDELVGEMVRCYVELGQSTLTIAAAAGVTDATVGRWLRSAGVQMRPPGRYRSVRAGGSST